MSPNEPQQPSISIPGKVFVLGEYAVLAGHSAVVAAVGPRFEAGVADQSGDVRGIPSHHSVIHSESPAGRWLTAQGRESGSLKWFDPHHGAGGFGASSAQFAFALHATGHSQLHWSDAWAFYRKIISEPETNSETIMPSGADLVAQWHGGAILFDPIAKSCRDVYSTMDWSGLLVFSATDLPGRKVETHGNLQKMRKFVCPESLGRVLNDGIAAILEGDVLRLGRAMDAYACELFNLGLEIPQASEDRKALRLLPGVVGVKGAGAGLADAVLVLMDPDSGSDERESVKAEAGGLGLRLVSDGLTLEPGASWLN